MRKVENMTERRVEVREGSFQWRIEKCGER
jgi:hypothetical protein